MKSLYSSLQCLIHVTYPPCYGYILQHCLRTDVILIFAAALWFWRGLEAFVDGLSVRHRTLAIYRGPSSAARL